MPPSNAPLRLDALLGQGEACQPEADDTCWLRLGLELRTRFEHAENDVRATHDGDAAGLFTRALLSAEATFGPVRAALELIDARLVTTDGTPLNSTHGDALDLLRGHVGLDLRDVLARGDALSLEVGRMTLDLGSRRLLARNDFRNTINSFTGIELRWTAPAGDSLRALAVTPVVRSPSAVDELTANAVAADRENAHALLLGAAFTSRPLAHGLRLDAALLGLFERDGPLAETSDRALLTPTLRLSRAPARGQLDLQLEVMGQLGRSRATSAPADTRDLTHAAFSAHASLGWRLDLPWSARAAVAVDHASGDRDPADGRQGRFDPLFGVRRFEFGPTGLFGAVSRSNLTSPALRLELQPHPRLELMASHRALWLAATRDAWFPAGVRDPSGQSGRFIGQLAELRVRWQLLPRNLMIEAGGAVLWRGPFATEAPGGRDDTPAFGYLQATATL